MSKAVQDRIQRCLTVMLAGYGYAGVLHQAASRYLHKYLVRERERLATEDAEAEPGQRGPSITDLMHLGAADLGKRCEAMVEADGALGRSRAELRRRRAERNRRAKRLYEMLTGIRKLLDGALGHQAACDYLDLRGPTPRDPYVLLKAARFAVATLADPSQAPALRYTDLVKPAQIAQRLEPLCHALAEAIAAVIAASAAEVGTQEHQRKAIARFDKKYKLTARLFERMLDYFGLPTLASTVRPGVKRRGRPPRVQPLDLYPDLVKQALKGMAGVETAVMTAPLGEAAHLNSAPDAMANLTAGAEAERGSETGDGKSSSGPRQMNAGDRKSETGSRQFENEDQKIETGLRKQPTGDPKSETGSRKRPAGDPKSKGGPLKLVDSDASPSKPTLSKPEPVHNRRRIVYRVDPLLTRAHRRSRRERQSASARLVASASAWWRRLRGVV